MPPRSSGRRPGPGSRRRSRPLTWRSSTCDAVVIGAGHNGLVAANLLADAGWDVLVVEAGPEAGGAVRSSSTLAPGFTTDLFSSYYPMTAASPVMRALELDRHGLVWSHAPAVLAHVRPDRPAAVLHRNATRTAAGLDDEHPGDGEAWLALAAEWDRYGQRLLEALLSPFPPVRSALRLGYAARLELWDLVRRTILPVRAMADELFAGDSPGLLLAGNALHADVTPDAAPSALLGWLLVGLGQTVGFPVPVGGAGRITDALLARLARAGGQVRVAEPVEQVLVTGREGHRRAHRVGHHHQPSRRHRGLRRPAALRPARRRGRPAAVVRGPHAAVPPRRRDGQGQLRPLGRGAVARCAGRRRRDRARGR